MPHIDFAEALADKTDPIAGLAAPSIFAESPVSVMESAYVEPAKFRRSRIGRSEWVNLSCAALTVVGGLFSAFYFFNGAELFRNALSWPRELLYPRPADALNPRQSSPLPAAMRPMAQPLPKTDPSGDPFPKAGGRLTIDRSLYAWVRESSGYAGGGGGVSFPPSTPGSPGVPGAPGIPGVPGSPGGHLPGPGTLISRLTLLVPGADQLTKALQSAAADLQKNITVTIRHDLPRLVNARKVVRRVRVVTGLIPATRGGARGLVQGARRGGLGAASSLASATTSVSNAGSGTGTVGSSSAPTASGVGAGSINSGLGSGIGGGLGGIIGGTGGGLVGGLGGAARGTVGGVIGGLTGGGRGGLGGLGGGGRH